MPVEFLGRKMTFGCSIADVLREDRKQWLDLSPDHPVILPKEDPQEEQRIHAEIDRLNALAAVI
jgi:hypothetical protein